MILIIDYGMGNLRSVEKGFERLKIKAKTSASLSEIEAAQKLVLPGVGFFSRGMQNLKSLGIFEILNYKVLEKKTPFLGICLGMQLVTSHSEEGNCAGLNWIPGRTMAFNNQKLSGKLKIPHIGWNTIDVCAESRLLNNEDTQDPFYFVHSYYVECESADYIVARTHYGIDFPSVIQHENIFGTQFHPEKSHSQGLKILKNFAGL